jgi:hypothetical protein
VHTCWGTWYVLHTEMRHLIVPCSSCITVHLHW